MEKLPGFLQKYFWDAEFADINLDEHRLCILRRILEYGDQQAAVWMWKNFKPSEIKKALVDFRGCSLKSANFWAFLLDINKKEVACLNKASSQEQKKIWPY